MGIQVEYNPDLALRNISEYWLFGEIPLIATKGNEILSRPIAGILIKEATHFIENGEVYTKGKYEAIEVFKNNKIYFECFDRIGIRKDNRNMVN